MSMEHAENLVMCVEIPAVPITAVPTAAVSIAAVPTAAVPIHHVGSTCATSSEVPEVPEVELGQSFRRVNWLENDPEHFKLWIPSTSLPRRQQNQPVLKKPIIAVSAVSAVFAVSARRDRCLPLNPPWGLKILKEGKCLENRGTSPQTMMTMFEQTGYDIWMGETKAVDPMYKGHNYLEIRAAPGQPSGLIGAARVVAVLDYTNPEHVAAIQNCASTAPWFAPGGNRNTGLVISHVAALDTNLPYKGMQGLHYLPTDVPSARDH